MDDELSEIRSGNLGRYANCFHVGFNSYEFVLDFGQSFQETESPQIHTRIVTSPVYAKTLWRILGQSLSNYESQHEEIPDLETQS